MTEPLRLVVWAGMPDPGALASVGRRIGRELEIEVISSNEDLERLLESQPPFDLITPSDYLVEKLVAHGRLADISDGVGKKWENLESWARHPVWDPEEAFCLPLAFGTTGLLVSESRTSGFESWEQFFSPEEDMRIGLLDEVREVVGAALIASGHSPNEVALDLLDQAGRLLRQQRNSVVSVSSDDFTGPVERGAVDVHHAWSGPASMAVRNDSDLRYVVPREGALLWTTTGAVPVDAPDPEAAVRFLRELADPELAAMAVTNGGYSTPNAKARAVLATELDRDRALFPDEETIRHCRTLTSLSREGELAMSSVLDRYSVPRGRAVDSRT